MTIINRFLNDAWRVIWDFIVTIMQAFAEPYPPNHPQSTNMLFRITRPCVVNKHKYRHEYGYCVFSVLMENKGIHQGCDSVGRNGNVGSF